ncbi:MAG: PadR family transcriptional regulator [Candidatus Micrarchaeaceae archaeon]
MHRSNCGCDMRGMLSFQILWLLSKKGMNGEEIAKEIEKRRGEKPKAGTLYPALGGMSERGLIKGSKKGRDVNYSITPLGRTVVKRSTIYFVRAFGDIMAEGRRRGKLY